MKVIGVDAKLRKQVLEAIDRGVKHLISLQEANGSFGSSHQIGLSALAGLALRHAATTEAKAAAAKATTFLHRDGSAWQRTYDAGITAMLLHADRKHRDLAKAIAQGLVLSQHEGNGWWGYRIYSSTTPRRGSSVNLSTTQFAVLGLWASERGGFAVSPKTWRRHLASLVQRQCLDGSWTYNATGGGTPAKGYVNGTMMGAANFALAEQALKGTLRQDPAFYRRYLAARLRMLDAVRRDGQSLLRPTKSKRPMPAHHFDYYGLYALEKACLFLGLERLGSMRWYPEAAKRLLQLQNPNGGWGRISRRRKKSRREMSDPIATSFALLVLLRSSEVYRPTTPSTIDTPRVVTGGDPDRPFR